MAYTHANEHKIGRMFIYFQDYYIILGRVYGAISLPIREKIRHYLEEAYARKLNVTNRWLVNFEKEVSSDQLDNCGHGNNCHDDYSVYFDLEVSALVRHQDKTRDFSGIYLEFEDGIDNYGDDTSSGKLHLEYCECCGEAILGDGNSTEDGLVCDYCLDEYYQYCPECYRYFHRDTEFYYIEDKEIDICHNCYQDGAYGICEKTDTYWSEDKLVEVQEGEDRIYIVNQDYADDNYQICDECGEYFDELEDFQDRRLCKSCLEKAQQQELQFAHVV